MWKRSDTFYHSRTLSKHFSAISQSFQQGRQKELSKLSIISGHWAKSFRPFVKRSRRATKTAFCVFTGIVSTKKLLEKKSWVFYFFSKIEWKNFGFLSTFFDGVVKSVIYVSIGTFRQKLFFKKFYLGFHFFSELDRKKFQPSATLFWAGLRKLHFTFL